MELNDHLHSHADRLALRTFYSTWTPLFTSFSAPRLLSIACVSAVNCFSSTSTHARRLESWPNVLSAVSISCRDLTANNESIWGLHLKLFSSSAHRFSFICVSLAQVLPKILCVHLSPGRITVGLPMEWSVLLKCWLSNRLPCGWQDMRCVSSPKRVQLYSRNLLPSVFGRCVKPLFISIFRNGTTL